MQAHGVVVLQNDSGSSQSLIASLGKSFPSVRAVASVIDLRSMIARQRADVVILDMELASLAEIQHLCEEFPALRVVCIHRLADDEMWTEALTAGAADICPSSDTKGILHAAVRSAITARSAAA